MHIYCLSAAVRAFRRIGLSVQADGADGDIRSAVVLHPVAHATADSGETSYQAYSRGRTQRRTRIGRSSWRGKATGEACPFLAEIKAAYEDFHEDFLSLYEDFLPFSGRIREPLYPFLCRVWQSARTND